MLLLYSMYSFNFTLLNGVKAVLVHGANRLLSESTLILYVERSGPVEGERAATSPEMEYSKADRNFRSERLFNAFGV